MPMISKLCSSAAQMRLIWCMRVQPIARRGLHGAVVSAWTGLGSLMPAKLPGMPDMFEEQRSRSRESTMHRMQTPGHIQAFYNATPGVAGSR